MNEAKESTRKTPRKAKYDHKLICGYLKRARSCTLWRSLISEPNAPWFVRQRARTIVNFAHDSNALATIVGEENRKMLVGRTLEKGGGTLLPRRQLNKKKKEVSGASARQERGLLRNYVGSRSRMEPTICAWGRLGILPRAIISVTAQKRACPPQIKTKCPVRTKQASHSFQGQN